MSRNLATIEFTAAEITGWGDLMTYYAGAYHPAGTDECRKQFEQKILTRLVALNAERAAEEKRGLIRWLRPDYQNPKGTASQTTFGLKTAKKAATKKAKV